MVLPQDLEHRVVVDVLAGAVQATLALVLGVIEVLQVLPMDDVIIAIAYYSVISYVMLFLLIILVYVRL